MLENICKEYDKEIEEILDALKYGFYENLDQDSFELDIVEPFEEHYDKSFGWDNGASKGVFIFKDFNFVIKIPFSYCDGDPLCGASEGRFDWDYCSQEVNRYDMAEQEGLQNVFLETAYLNDIDGYPIYIQPFAEPLDKINDREAYHSGTKEDIKEVENILEKSEYSYINCEWEADIYALYGKQYYKKFKDFIKDREIEDLRHANVGYIGLNPVILDYAGFDY